MSQEKLWESVGQFVLVTIAASLCLVIEALDKGEVEEDYFDETMYQ